MPTQPNELSDDWKAGYFTSIKHEKRRRQRTRANLSRGIEEFYINIMEGENKKKIKIQNNILLFCKKYKIYKIYIKYEAKFCEENERKHRQKMDGNLYKKYFKNKNNYVNNSKKFT